MDSSAIAWTAMILVVVFLSLTFAPNWSLAILILVGQIAQAFDNFRKKTPDPPSSPDPPPGDPPGDPPDSGSDPSSDLGSGSGTGSDFRFDHQAGEVDARPTRTHNPDEENPLDFPPGQRHHSFGIEHSAADASAPAVDAAGKTGSEPELSSTSSSSYAFEYDVYLNFRGEDTGHGFIDHLCRKLKVERISVSKGNHDIGETSLKVNENIKRSRISIAVLSKSYASSKWCLMELVEMWKCRESNGQSIIPIFYEVSPLDIARDFERSFDRYVKDEVGSDTIETWKEVLRKIGDLSGYHPEGNDGELVNRVVAHVAQLLKKEDQVEEIMRKLGVAYDDGQAMEVRGEEVRVVGIWGVPSVGKTTLAKIVFNKICELFEASIFLEDVSFEEAPISRQMLIADLKKQKLAPLESSTEGIEDIESLCRNAKVLIVLDNVNENEQIIALAGKLTWFGPGSRIIVTTDKREVLRAFEADDRGTVEEYEVKSMDRGAPRPAGDALAPTGKRGRDAVSSSTPSSLSGIKYGVLLNFRGTDSTTITDHLFRSLVDVGISVFKEDKELHDGKEIGPGFKEAIKQSRISIAILSTDYASSEWCLVELVQMWECRKLNGQIIIPIFYNVSPSDVRHQAGDFGEAFSLHEKRVDSETIKKWREVLGDIAELPGYSGKLYEGYEDQLAEEVVLRVARDLRDDGLAVTDELVGIDLYVQEMMRKLGVAHCEGRETEVHGEDVRVIGISGEPGVGKTTLAKVIYNEVHTLFEAYSFLEGIGAKGVRVSQQLLIADLLNLGPAPLGSVDEAIKKISSLFRNKKVLIVLDDVNEDEQIKALAGKLTWFGSGSRIIVTTGNSKVLSAFNVGANDRGTVEELKIELGYQHVDDLDDLDLIAGEFIKNFHKKIRKSV